MDVSVLTACLSPNPDYLMKVYSSLAEQKSCWEWIIQLDGDDSLLDNIPSILRDNSQVHIACNGERLGTAASRNIGLLACKSDFVANTDADDWWHPGKLDMLLETLKHYEEAALCFGQVRLERDDKLWSLPSYKEGLIQTQVIADNWLQTSHHHITLSHAVWRKRNILACGGWAAQRGQQDVNLALAVTENFPSVYVAEEVGVYRQHALQATQQVELTGYDERHRRLIAQRLIAMREISGNGLLPSQFAMRDGTLRSIFIAEKQ